ncbi:MAG: hypothetical protein Kow00122_05330 [Thermoleophilia bacterium]
MVLGLGRTWRDSRFFGSLLSCLPRATVPRAAAPGGSSLLPENRRPYAIVPAGVPNASEDAGRREKACRETKGAGSCRGLLERKVRETKGRWLPGAL